MMVMMVVVMMIIVVMMMVMVIVMMIVVMVIVSHDHRLFFRTGSIIAALVLCAQNLLGIRDGLQQLGKRAGRLQEVDLIDGRRSGRLRCAEESERRRAAQQPHDGLVHDVPFPA